MFKDILFKDEFGKNVPERLDFMGLWIFRKIDVWLTKPKF